MSADTSTGNAGQGLFTILGLCGSLRDRSYNWALLRAFAEESTSPVEVVPRRLADLPLYNPDWDQHAGGAESPHPVHELRHAVEQADALLLVGPEYIWGPSAALKNALEWLSRPVRDNPLLYKSIGLAGASQGPAGTGRAQLQLRQQLLSCRALIMPDGDLQFAHAPERFDEDLVLSDLEERQRIFDHLQLLVAWTDLLGARARRPQITGLARAVDPSPDRR